MDARSIEHDLLLGLMAVQTGALGREQFVEVMREWLTDRTQALESLLLRKRFLDQGAMELVKSLVKHFLSKHGDDPARSVNALVENAGGIDELRAIGDADVNATLGPPLGPARASQVSTLDPAPSAEPPSSGRFQFVRKHARGGLGEVSVARDLELNREVALKEIQRRYVSQESSRVRFVLEAEITGALEHPGIVPVYSLGAYPDGRPFYAMRFIRGESLAAAIKSLHERASATRSRSEWRSDLRKLVGRLVAVCHAVEYAHSRGIIHRDLKPDNIMLGRFGETLVVDWGLAKPIGRAEPYRLQQDEATLVPRSGSSSAPTMAGVPIGTVGFMSPEQAAGDAERQTIATDIYSLGAILYCILTGRATIAGVDLATFQRRVAAGDFPRARAVAPHAPPALDAVSWKALSTRPEDRYATARDLAEDLDRWLADEPVAVYREPAFDRLFRAIRRHRTGFTAAAAFIMSAAFILGVTAALIAAKNQELSLALQAAKQQERQARSEQNRAELNAETARSSIMQILATTEEMARDSAMGGLRKQLADLGLSALKQLNATQPNDEPLRMSLAKSLHFWSNLIVDDDLEKALQANIEAAKLLDRPDEQLSIGALASRASILRDQGSLRRRSGDYPAAIANLRRALQLIEIAQSRRSEPDLGRIAASIKSDLAWNLIEVGKYDEGLALSTSAADFLGQLNPAFKKEDVDDALLLLAIRARSEALSRTEQPEAAVQLLRESLATIANTESDNANTQAGIATAEQRLASIQSRHRLELEAAAKSARSSVQRWRKLVAEQRQTTRFNSYRRGLGQALVEQAAVDLNLERLDDAAKAANEALDILQQQPFSDRESVYDNEVRARALWIAARAARKSGATDVGVALQSRAIELQRRLVRIAPEHVQFQADLKQMEMTQ